MTINFKGSHYPKDVILYAVFFYVRYAVSYKDLEEIMAERSHARWHRSSPHDPKFQTKQISPFKQFVSLAA
jgi:hypothetical protein